MEDDVVEAPPAPRPRPFPAGGPQPGPRCGHTLTAIALDTAPVTRAGGAAARGLDTQSGRRGERCLTLAPSSPCLPAPACCRWRENASLIASCAPGVLSRLAFMSSLRSSRLLGTNV
jgi:hypothetical protein